MDALRLDFAVRLRSFRLELALEVGAETVGLVGPSGAGKTTVLRTLAGLTRPDEGRIALGDDVWLDVAANVDRPPERRSVGYVFQDYALFPHLSVARNVSFGARRDVASLLERLRIDHLAEERPGRISGGERQRVALARALAREPGVLLLDEPLAALDAHTRARVRADLHDHLRSARLPTVLVSHDYEDAVALADRIGVLVDGKLVQLGRPEELVAAPASPFVADFTGANVLSGVASPGANGLTEVTLLDGTRLLSTDRARGEVGVVVYPWEVALARSQAADSMQNHIRAPVASIVPVANRVRVRVGVVTAEVTAASAERLELKPGDVVVASFKATGTRLLPRG